MSKSSDLMQLGIVTQDLEREDRIVYNVPIYIQKAVIDNDGFELFAAKYGWTPTITNEQGEVVANPQKPWEKCNEVIWDFIREVFKSEMIARAMQQAKEIAEEQVNQVIY